MRHEAVWITGVGAATPLGHCYKTNSAGLLAGRSGVRSIERFDISHHPSQIAAQLEPFPATPTETSKEFETMGIFEQISFWCCIQALQDSGLWDARTDTRIGLVFGVGAEWPLRWECDWFAGGNAISEIATDKNLLVANIQKTLSLRGPFTTVSVACASGSAALMLGKRWVELGLVDVCLAGGCETPVTRIAMASFGNLRALSRKNDSPETASRPFDTDRDGFVMGEGGAMFVLEREDLARSRSAKSYAQLAGCGATSDASHMVIPSPDPIPASTAMRRALAEAEVNPDDVNYVHAHATSTPVGDVGETRILKTVFGDHTQNMPVSGTKSMTGHLIAGSGPMGVLACLTALQRQAIPPTINLDNPDPECDLFHVPNQAIDFPVNVVVCNALGFGGSNVSLVLKKVG
ncbi:MAG: beta-ketoacyl-[acyl-carrier-protein] synthase family protein [Gemmataceae bacterium]